MAVKKKLLKFRKHSIPGSRRRYRLDAGLTTTNQSQECRIRVTKIPGFAARFCFEHCIVTPSIAFPGYFERPLSLPLPVSLIEIKYIISQAKLGRIQVEIAGGDVVMLYPIKCSQRTRWGGKVQFGAPYTLFWATEVCIRRRSSFEIAFPIICLFGRVAEKMRRTTPGIVFRER